MKFDVAIAGIFSHVVYGVAVPTCDQSKILNIL